MRAWRLFERVLTAKARGAEPGNGADGLAIPPAKLRVKVIAQTDSQLFLSSGADDAAAIRTLAAQHDLPTESARRLLDFGCGCGRVVRHWAALTEIEVHATDHDPELIDWVRANLPFVRSDVNGLAPPLPYPDEHFGLVYSISVFTHLTEGLARDWMLELRRVIRPGGLLLYSVMADHNLDRLRPRERASFERGEIVVQFEEAAGTNLCVAYHPQSYLARLTAGFEPVGSRRVGLQDMHVVRRLAS